MSINTYHILQCFTPASTFITCARTIKSQYHLITLEVSRKHQMWGKQKLEKGIRNSTTAEAVVLSIQKPLTTIGLATLLNLQLEWT